MTPVFPTRITPCGELLIQHLPTTIQAELTMSRLSTLSLMTALISGSVYAAPSRTAETLQRVSETQPAEMETNVQAIEKRNAIADARKAVGNLLRENG